MTQVVSNLLKELIGATDVQERHMQAACFYWSEWQPTVDKPSLDCPDCR
ncbi:MAG TPA: hypothetical protein VLI05_02730 [Candidatus Saccharimonadia bacterium]|nr:hypothetical protein [Candidatus Saccharimonadia bacterium]